MNQAWRRWMFTFALCAASAVGCGSSSPGTGGGAGTSGGAGTTAGAAGTSGGGGMTAGTAGAASGAAGSNDGSAAGASTGGSSGAAGANDGGAAGAGGATSGVAGSMGTAGAGGATGGATGATDPKSYTCNLLLGVSVTHDWFLAGFETYVDNAKWEAMASSTADVSFIQTWDDPNGSTWTQAKLSPCTQNAESPERIIFTGVNWDYTTAAEWVTAYDMFVQTAQAKYTSVKEIDLMTMLRAPNDMMSGACTSVEDVVQPFIDAAIQTTVAKYPTLVHAAPKVYAPDCTVFTGGGPHYTAAGAMTIAKVYGDLYAAEP